MFSKVLLCCVLAFAAAQQSPADGQPPQPYTFSYDNTDEFGTRISQEETGDENNNKVGSYSYTDAAGLTRTVKYTADADGFHVVVETNEPGTKTSNPADAQYISNAAEVAPAPAAVAVKPAPVVVKATPVVQAVHAAPVAIHAVHAAPTFTLHAAPVSFATAHHVTPVAVAAHPVAFHAPLTYTLGRAKSR
uniref:Putative cuticle protein n=1 Tax=Amblyomma triste TaxID=251400 RepID=A0A023GMM1_AMBTT